MQSVISGVIEGLVMQLCSTRLDANAELVVFGFVFFPLSGALTRRFLTAQLWTLPRYRSPSLSLLHSSSLMHTTARSSDPTRLALLALCSHVTTSIDSDH